MPIIRTINIYVSKDVRTHGYFLKPKEVHEQKGLATSYLTYSNKFYSYRFSLNDTAYEFFVSLSC